MKQAIVAIALILGFAQAASADQWYGEREYLRCNVDVARAVYNGQFDSGWHHYVTHGQYENRITDGRCQARHAPRWFNENGYLRCHQDVRRAVRRGDFASGWHHYRQHGRSEGRQWNCR